MCILRRLDAALAPTWKTVLESKVMLDRAGRAAGSYYFRTLLPTGVRVATNLNPRETNRPRAALKKYRRFGVQRQLARITSAGETAGWKKNICTVSVRFGWPSSGTVK